MADDLHEILKSIGDGRLPSRIPSDCPYAEDLDNIVRSLADIHRFANALAGGDMSATLGLARGPLAGSLKTLQVNLRHLTSQMEKVVLGDFGQRADFANELSAAFNKMVEKMESLQADLHRASTHDALTGLYNRAYFDSELERLSRGRRFPSSIVIVDVDRLQAVNEEHGSAAGDQLLLSAAGLLLTAFRGEDIVARTGGDEFGVILPGVDEKTATDILDRIRATLHTAGQAAAEAECRPALILSLGAATASNGQEVAETLKLATERMSREKDAHRIFEI
jgi:two-component system cell cycle response regulator